MPKTACPMKGPSPSPPLTLSAKGTACTPRHCRVSDMVGQDSAAREHVPARCVSAQCQSQGDSKLAGVSQKVSHSLAQTIWASHRRWMQPGVGLPRVFSLVMKRCFPRRFRDSAAQALELPQHHSGAAQVRHPHLGLGAFHAQ